MHKDPVVRDSKEHAFFNVNLCSGFFQGAVVGFSGASVYCLSSQSVKRVDVQLAPAMYYYLDAGHLQEAYQLACLGVTESDWRELGNIALTNMELEVNT